MYFDYEMFAIISVAAISGAAFYVFACQKLML